MDGPKTEFGNPPDDREVNGARCPLRVFATRLHTALSQSTLVLLDRLPDLRRIQELDHGTQQAQQLQQLSVGVQCVSYYVQKWAAVVDIESASRPLTKPTASDNTDDRLAVIQMVLPRLLIALANLQGGIRQLAAASLESALADLAARGRPAPRTEEEIELQQKEEENARRLAEQAAEEELNKRGITLENLHSTVPQME